MPDNEETKKPGNSFDPSPFPEDTCFYERRTGLDRRHEAEAAKDEKAEDRQPPERRRKDRRRRVDPTTFEKQYTPEELDFMNAMQRFKVRTGKPFPTYGEVLTVALGLGYRKAAEASSLPR